MHLDSLHTLLLIFIFIKNLIEICIHPYFTDEKTRQGGYVNQASVVSLLKFSISSYIAICVSCLKINLWQEKVIKIFEVKGKKHYELKNLLLKSDFVNLGWFNSSFSNSQKHAADTDFKGQRSLAKT